MAWCRTGNNHYLKQELPSLLMHGHPVAMCKQTLFGRYQYRHHDWSCPEMVGKIPKKNRHQENNLSEIKALQKQVTLFVNTISPSDEHIIYVDDYSCIGQANCVCAKESAIWSLFPFSYNIVFSTRHNDPIIDNKNKLFIHQFRVAVTLSTFLWWRHNWLRYAKHYATRLKISKYHRSYKKNTFHFI